MLPSLAETHIWWPGVVLLGLAVGLAAGMFGVGGGFLLVPLLNVLFGIPLPVAAGTGLCQMIGTSVAAFVRHRRLRQGEEKAAALMLAGSLLGVQGGAVLQAHLQRLGDVILGGREVPAAQYWLSLAYMLLLTLIGIGMLRDARSRPASRPLPAGPLTRLPLPPYTRLPVSDRRVSIPAMAYLGLVPGFLSGLLGVGGGVVLTPLLLYGVGMRMRVAAASGALLLFATSVAGTIAHVQLGHVHLGLAMVLLAGSTIAAPLGATLTARLPGHHLRAVFACLVFATALAVGWNLVRLSA